MLASRDGNIKKEKSFQELTAVYFENFLITCISLKTNEKKEYFGSFSEGRFIETLEAKIVMKTWTEIPHRYHNCSLGNYGFSPNGFTGILKFDARKSGINCRKYIHGVILSFKARSTKLLNQLQMTPSRIFWENGFTETPIENLNDLSEALNKINNHR